MAIVESKTKKNEIYYRIFPDMSRKIDYKNRIIEYEISLPGVLKENIEVKALPGWFHLSAKRNHIEYSANQSFGKEIVPDKTTAKYENGLLKIIAHIRDPFDGAREIQL